MRPWFVTLVAGFLAFSCKATRFLGFAAKQISPARLQDHPSTPIATKNSMIFVISFGATSIITKLYFKSTSCRCLSTTWLVSNYSSKRTRVPRAA